MGDMQNALVSVWQSIFFLLWCRQRPSLMTCPTTAHLYPSGVRTAGTPGRRWMERQTADENSVALSLLPYTASLNGFAVGALVQNKENAIAYMQGITIPLKVINGVFIVKLQTNSSYFRTLVGDVVKLVWRSNLVQVLKILSN